MKIEDVTVGMAVVLKGGDASKVGTVKKRDGRAVQVDFGDGKVHWNSARELEPAPDDDDDGFDSAGEDLLPAAAPAPAPRPRGGHAPAPAPRPRGGHPRRRPVQFREGEDVECVHAWPFPLSLHRSDTSASLCRYHSTTYGDWIEATVERVHSDGSITLDVRERADPSKVRHKRAVSPGAPPPVPALAPAPAPAPGHEALDDDTAVRIAMALSLEPEPEPEPEPAPECWPSRAQPSGARARWAPACRCCSSGPRAPRRSWPRPGSGSGRRAAPAAFNPEGIPGVDPVPGDGQCLFNAIDQTKIHDRTAHPLRLEVVEWVRDKWSANPDISAMMPHLAGLLEGALRLHDAFPCSCRNPELDGPRRLFASNGSIFRIRPGSRGSYRGTHSWLQRDHLPARQ